MTCCHSHALPRFAFVLDGVQVLTVVAKVWPDLCEATLERMDVLCLASLEEESVGPRVIVSKI
jgi:hypothetical protein